MTASVLVRSATPADVSAIFEQIRALAEYERLLHEVIGSAIALEQHLFGSLPYVEALIAELAGKPVGFALYFRNYSTLTMQPGIYLEDLFVQPTVRGQGVGKALLSSLAQRVLDRQWEHLNWAVLDWNEPAIAFYRRIGAEIFEDVRICRVRGSALTQLAQQAAGTRLATATDLKGVVALVEADIAVDGGSFQGQSDLLKQHLFGSQPYAETIVVEQDGNIAGLALFCTSYSTFLTQPGLYVEDLFVWPQYQGQGLEIALLAAVAQQAIDRACGRLEWGVCTWNQAAIRLYERLGAVIMPDWRRCTLSATALSQLAASLEQS